MLILTATNITGGNGTRKDGTSKYDVWVGINDVRIWGGIVDGHVRKSGAAKLLRRIANDLLELEEIMENGLTDQH